MSNIFPSPLRMNPTETICIERHYTVAQIAEMWGYSTDTIRRTFENEPGVIGIGKRLTVRKRRHITIRIPESVLRQVHHRLMDQGRI